MYIEYTMLIMHRPEQVDGLTELRTVTCVPPVEFLSQCRAWSEQIPSSNPACGITLSTYKPNLGAYEPIHRRSFDRSYGITLRFRNGSLSAREFNEAFGGDRAYILYGTQQRTLEAPNDYVVQMLAKRPLTWRQHAAAWNDVAQRLSLMGHPPDLAKLDLEGSKPSSFYQLPSRNLCAQIPSLFEVHNVTDEGIAQYGL